MPSVLVETGFLTYKPEGEYLNSSKGQQEMGEAIANAIIDYKNKIESSSTNNQPNTTKSDEKKVVEEKITEVAPKVIEKKDKEPVVIVKPPVERQKNKEDIIFKVQIFASANSITVTPKNFKGLNNISKEGYKNLFRYMYGSTASYNYVNSLKEDAVRKGYKDAYIVRIDVKEALKYASE